MQSRTLSQSPLEDDEVGLMIQFKVSLNKLVNWSKDKIEEIVRELTSEGLEKTIQ